MTLIYCDGEAKVEGRRNPKKNMAEVEKESYIF
jgi:hypothetical protein